MTFKHSKACPRQSRVAPRDSIPSVTLSRFGSRPSEFVLVDQPRGDLIQLDPSSGVVTVEAFVLPAELLE